MTIATPVWKYIVIGVDIIAALLLVFAEVMVVRKWIKRKKNDSNE